MATVTSKTKEEHDQKEMARKGVVKDKANKPEEGYAHPQRGGGKIAAYPVGMKVKNDSNQHGSISHIHYGEGEYPHSYRVVSDKTDKDGYKEHLEHGNYISHTRLTPVEKEES